MDFADRCVFISGGTSGIGLGLAVELAARGAHIFVFSVDSADRREVALTRIRAARRSPDQRCAALELDVTDHVAVERELAAAARDFGPPSLLVNSAGIGGAVYFDQLSYERFDATVKISLYGARNTIAALFPFMRDNGGGYIVNVSSMSGLIGIIGYAAYASAKFGMVGLSEALRSEFKRFGIHVAALCPPQVDTPLLRETDRTKPAEVKAINNNAGLLTPAQVALAVIRGLEKKERIIIPGRKARLFHLFHRLFPGLRERATDRVIRRVQRETAARSE